MSIKPKRIRSQIDSGREKCSICYNNLPSPGLFCQYCDPPLPPDPVPDSVLSSGKTLFYLIILIILFFAGAIFKLEIPLDMFIPFQKIEDTSSKEEEGSPTPDFKVVHKINVPMANLRANSSSKAKIIITLKKNDEVILLEQQDRWSKIIAREKTGWISNKLLDSKVQ